MPGTAGPRLGLVWGYAVGDAGWGLGGFNPNFATLETLTQLAVRSITSTPISSPANGDCYIIGTGATGAWTSRDNSIAVWYTTGTPAWLYLTPRAGYRAFNIATSSYWRFDGATWIEEVYVPPPTGASITVSDTAPASPTPGNAWFDSATCSMLYIYVDDGTSSQWLPAVNQSGAGGSSEWTGGDSLTLHTSIATDDVMVFWEQPNRNWQEGVLPNGDFQISETTSGEVRFTIEKGWGNNRPLKLMANGSLQLGDAPVLSWGGYTTAIYDGAGVVSITLASTINEYTNDTHNFKRRDGSLRFEIKDSELVAHRNVSVNAGVNAALVVNKDAGPGVAGIVGQTGGQNRWKLTLCNWAGDSGSDAGSDFNLERVTDDGSGHLALAIQRATGTATFYNNFVVQGTASKPGGGVWADSSDIQVKQNVYDYTTGLDAVMRLRPVSFEFNGKGGTPLDGKTYVGLIANEAKEVMPEMVSTTNETLVKGDDHLTEILTLDATALIYALTNSVKELAARIAALEDKLR